MFTLIMCNTCVILVQYLCNTSIEAFVALVMQPHYYDKIKIPSIGSDRTKRNEIRPLLQPYTLPDLGHCRVSSHFSSECPVVDGEGRLTDGFRDLIYNTTSHLERCDEHEEEDQFRIDQDVRWRNHVERVATTPGNVLSSSLPSSVLVKTQSPKKSFEGRRRRRPISTDTIMSCILDESFEDEDKGWDLEGNTLDSIRFPSNDAS